MTTPQEAMRNNFEAVFIAAIRNSKPGTLKDIARLCYEAALTQQEEEPVCAGCGIPEGDVHISTCQSGKWPLRVSNGDTATPAPQPLTDKEQIALNKRELFARMEAPVAWVWNPASIEWEKVRSFGHWQQGALYAFGPTQPGPIAAPAPQPARGGAELIARATKVASDLDDFNASLDRKAAKCIRELLSALQSAQSVVAQPDHIPDAGEMVPLTDDRVIGLLAEHGCIGAQSKNDFVAGLRYGEAAHGIGVGNTIGK